jgi:hypothetical protein
MRKNRPEFTVSFRVLDESGKTLDIIKRTGFNKQNLQWQAERLAEKKYGNKVKLHRFKVVEESD